MDAIPLYFKNVYNNLTIAFQGFS